MQDQTRINRGCISAISQGKIGLFGSRNGEESTDELLCGGKIIEEKGEGTMALLGNKLGTWRLAWTRESPLRDYMWGAIIVAFGLFTIIGMVFLFGG